MKDFTKLLVSTILLITLCSCARDPNPLTEINDGIQQNVIEIIDYAKNNMVIDTDKQFLIEGMKDCAARADAMTKTYTASMEKCTTEKSKLKLERNGLFVVVLLLAGVMLYKPIRKFLPL